VKRVAVLGDCPVLRVLDAVKRAAVPAGAEPGHRLPKPQPAHALRLEGLIHGHRAVDEPQLGRDDRDLDAISGQGTQREQRLQPRDAGAGDEHPWPARVHDLADVAGAARRSLVSMQSRSSW
jgi:hypothetical protein